MGQYTFKDSAAITRTAGAVPNTGAQVAAESLSFILNSESPVSAPVASTPSLPVRHANSDIFRTSFVDSGSGLLASGFSLLQTGSGMTVAQSAGNLTIATGTTTNSQTLIRSTRTFAGPLMLRAKLTSSQRIINQQFSFWLADLLGTGLAYTTDGTGTNITVTWPTGQNPFTTTSVGQGVNLGQISGTGVPGRYVIQSVSGDTATFAAIGAATWTRSTTVATVSMLGGSHDVWTGTSTGVVSASSDVTAIVNGTVSPTSSGGSFTFTCLNAGAANGTLTYQDTSRVFAASASGTLTVWGYNAYKVCYRDASATNANFDSTRKGYGLADTVASINTSAAPGHIAQVMTDGAFVDFVDSAASSSTGYQFSSRATRLENIPDETTVLHLFIEAKNGTTAPATTTTWSVGMVIVEQIGNGKVMVSAIASEGIGRGQKVSVNDMPTVTVTNTTTLSTSANGVSTFHHAISAASTNATSVKASAGCISAIILGNTTASVKYFKLFNKASAPTVGTDTPIATIVLPPTNSFAVPFDMFPERLGTGIAYSITGGAAVADTTAVAVNDVTVHIAYA